MNAFVLEDLVSFAPSFSTYKTYCDPGDTVSDHCAPTTGCSVGWRCMEVGWPIIVTDTPSTTTLRNRASVTYDGYGYHSIHGATNGCI